MVNDSSEIHILMHRYKMWKNSNNISLVDKRNTFISLSISPHMLRVKMRWKSSRICSIWCSQDAISSRNKHFLDQSSDSSLLVHLHETRSMYFGTSQLRDCLQLSHSARTHSLKMMGYSMVSILTISHLLFLIDSVQKMRICVYLRSQDDENHSRLNLRYWDLLWWV